jgi:hypothetical protein
MIPNSIVAGAPSPTNAWCTIGQLRALPEEDRPAKGHHRLLDGTNQITQTIELEEDEKEV